MARLLAPMPPGVGALVAIRTLLGIMCVLQADIQAQDSSSPGYARSSTRTYNSWPRAPPEQAPVGAGSEGGDRVSTQRSRWADFAYCRRNPQAFAVRYRVRRYALVTGFYLPRDHRAGDR